MRLVLVREVNNLCWQGIIQHTELVQVNNEDNKTMRYSHILGTVCMNVPQGITAANKP